MDTEREIDELVAYAENELFPRWFKSKAASQGRPSIIRIDRRDESGLWWGEAYVGQLSRFSVCYTRVSGELSVADLSRGFVEGFVEVSYDEAKAANPRVP